MRRLISVLLRPFRKSTSFFLPDQKQDKRRKLLFSKSFCKIYYHEDINAIHLDWGKFATKVEFIQACDLSLTLMIRYKASKMIADNSRAALVAMDNQNWLTDDWFPRALKNGFRYSAVVVSNEVFVRHAVTRIEERIRQEGLTIEYFDSVESARQWLASVA